MLDLARGDRAEEAQAAAAIDAGTPSPAPGACRNRMNAVDIAEEGVSLQIPMVGPAPRRQHATGGRGVWGGAGHRLPELQLGVAASNATVVLGQGAVGFEARARAEQAVGGVTSDSVRALTRAGAPRSLASTVIRAEARWS